MPKTLYIIPGYGGSGKGLEKVPLAVAAKRKGYRIVPVRITWKRRVPSQWIAEASGQIREPNSFILGFSFGAFIAVALAKTFRFKKLLLASLSPYFADDVKHLPPAWRKALGKRRVADAATHAFPTHILTPAIFFVGDKEHPLAIRRTRRAHAHWKGRKQLEVITGGVHDIGAPEYSTRILKHL